MQDRSVGAFGPPVRHDPVVALVAVWDESLAFLGPVMAFVFLRDLAMGIPPVSEHDALFIQGGTEARSAYLSRLAFVLSLGRRISDHGGGGVEMSETGKEERHDGKVFRSFVDGMSMATSGHSPGLASSGSLCEKDEVDNDGSDTAGVTGISDSNSIGNLPGARIDSVWIGVDRGIDMKRQIKLVSEENDGLRTRIKEKSRILRLLELIVEERSRPTVEDES